MKDVIIKITLTVLLYIIGIFIIKKKGDIIDNGDNKYFAGAEISFVVIYFVAITLLTVFYIF